MSVVPRVAIFGASSGIGIELARRLAAAGSPPVAVTRSGAAPALATAGATQQRADVLDRAAIDRVLAVAPRADALVSLVGGRPFRKEPPPDWDGNRNLVDAANAAGIRRFVLVSTIGAGGSRAAAPWIARLVLGRFMALKTQAEDYLRLSGLDWTIVRPGHLTDQPAGGQGQLLEDEQVSGAIPRADVAALVERVLQDPATIGRTYAAIARAG
ncbi:MAG: NAD(P)H-binding protein [Steroidobacteraceae bacterium]|nr:NAD(P)H-binding protein [Steroidobacteraceae bacterium]